MARCPCPALIGIPLQAIGSARGGRRARTVQTRSESPLHSGLNLVSQARKNSFLQTEGKKHDSKDFLAFFPTGLGKV